MAKRPMLERTMGRIDAVYDVLKDLGVTRDMIIPQAVRTLSREDQERLERELNGKA